MPLVKLQRGGTALPRGRSAGHSKQSTPAQLVDEDAVIRVVCLALLRRSTVDRKGSTTAW